VKSSEAPLADAAVRPSRDYSPVAAIRLYRGESVDGDAVIAKRTLKRDTEPDAVRVFGAALAIAWQKYHRAFNDVPHGTLEQMACLLELAGGRKHSYGLQLMPPNLRLGERGEGND